MLRNNKPFIVKYGVDYSITSPCFSIVLKDISDGKLHTYSVIVNGKNEIFYEIHKKNNLFEITILPTSQTHKHNLERYVYITNQILGWLDDKIKTLKLPNPDIINIEGYSMGSKGKTFNIAENTQTFKLEAYKKYNCSFLEIPPSNLKQFAGQKGNCGKVEMAKGFEDYFGFCLYKEFEKKVGSSPLNDVIDSIFLTLFEK